MNSSRDFGLKKKIWDVLFSTTIEAKKLNIIGLFLYTLSRKGGAGGREDNALWWWRGVGRGRQIC